jgi:hypothetical protein
MTETITHPDMAAIYSELVRLGVPMKGWWAEPAAEEFGLDVDPAALADTDSEYMQFAWSAENGWTMHEGYPANCTALATAGPFDVAAVAKRLKAVIDGADDEFQAVTAR